MAPLQTVSSVDGPRITVNDFIKDPLRIAALVIDMTNQGFLADALLRQAGEAEAGVVRFHESTPMYADDEPETRAEFAEVPIAATSEGTPKVAYVEEKALGIVISDRMRRRRIVDPVTRQLIQVKNTLFRSWDAAFMDALINNAGVNTVAGGDWALDATDVRAQINEARRLIEIASPEGHSEASEFGFEADVLVVNKTTKFDLLNNEDFSKVYAGDISDENLRYTGKLPRQILGLNVVASSRVPAGKAIVMQRNVAGFIADELPLEASELYRVEEKKLWRADVMRASAIGIDQPKAVTVISGVNG